MKKQPTEAVFEPVEPRILFSADGLGGMAVDLAEPMPEEPALEASLHENDAETDQNQVQENDSLLSDNQLRTELVFVDPNVEGYEDLLDDLLSNGHDRNFEIHMLDNGIEDITSALQGIDDVSALHIIAHGDAGEIQIGATTITNDTFEEFNDTLTGWSDSLHTDADILFYGCNVAGSDNGQQLLGRIAAATGADIGASDDLTGHVDAGGDWILEYKHGELETEIAISDEGQADFEGVLDIDSNLVAHYDFEEGSGTTANDVAPSDAVEDDGSLQGTTAPSYTTGHIGSHALDFSAASDDRVVISDSSDLDFGSGDFTISAWFNTGTVSGSAERIIGKLNSGSDPGFVIYNDNLGDTNFMVSDGSNSINLWGSGFQDNAWHQVTAIRSGNNFELYIDNVLVDSTTQALGNIDNNNELLLGISSGNTSNYDGLLDEVRLYDRALNATDRTELYNYAGEVEITVDTTNDTLDGDTSSLSALVASKGADGFISLREAITAANNDPSATIINLGAGTYDMTSGSGDSAGDFDIRSDITIRGAGIGSTIIEGSNTSDRIFHIISGSASISDLTIQNSSNSVNGSGINVASGAELTVDSVRFYNNVATNSNGGAIQSSGTLTVNNSTFDSNQASNGSGGAIQLVSPGTTTITNSLFVNNQSSNGNGGAINATSTLSVTNSTFSGNSTSNGDGAIQISGNTTLTNVTITDTSSDRGSVRVTNSGTLNISNTIIAGNTGSTHDDLSLAGSATVNDNGNNLIGDGTGQSALVNGVNGNQVGTSGSPIDPLLGALADNGGPTLSHALLAGSSAIDAGTNSGASANDQRGYVRDGLVDIGAYEFNAVVAGAPSDVITNSTTEGGLSINSDGGNDIYLQADNLGLFDGANAFTIEAQISLDGVTGKNTILSYETALGGNDVLLWFTTPGELQLQIGGAHSVNAGVNISELNNGEKQTISVSWDNTSGDWAFYINGQARNSGTGLQVGHSVDGGGTLVFGQEQDGVGTGFDSSEAFQGTFYDVRIFEDVRSANEIEINYNTALAHDEQGLLGNWHFDALATDQNGNQTIIDDLVGNNLTVQHATGAGYTASNPTLTFSVNEYALDGTIVGSVAGIDEERNAQIDALLAADSDLVYNAETNKFYKAVSTTGTWAAAQTASTSTTLNSVGGQLVTIRSATEQEIVHSLAQGIGNSVWIGASDSDNEGDWNWYSGTTVNDSFWQGDSNGYAVENAYTNWKGGEPNNAGGGEDVAYLSNTNGVWNDTAATDSFAGYVIEWNADDVLDQTQALTYSIQSQTESGAFAINSDTGVITVADGSVLDYEANATHTLNIRVQDADGLTFDKAFTINLNNLIDENTAPTNLSSGIEINTDGGNDAYLLAQNGSAILGGLSELTFETSFVYESGAQPTFISYATGSNNDEFRVFVGSSSDLQIWVDGVSQNTGLTLSDITAGEHTSIAVSWDNVNGDWAIYLNGEHRNSGSGLAVGMTLETGGELVLGQEQDSILGGFESSEAFQGTLYDVRIWNEVRSEAEIASNYQNKFDTGSLPTGLIANWQMDGFNGSNQVVDVVSGNNLSIGHATGAGFTTSTPVQDLHVNENASNGTSVGFVIPSESDIYNDLISDGGFLKGDNGTWQPYGQGATIGDWTVIEGSVDHTSQYSSPLGGLGLELERGVGNPGGTIGQTITTEVGKQYQLIFSATGNFSGGDAIKHMRASAGGVSMDYAIEDTGVYETYSFTFAATSTSTDVLLQGLRDTGFGAVVSDVRVIEIPAAVSTILNNDPSLTYDAATDKFYRVVDTQTSWTSADTAARAAQLNGLDGQLVTIRTSYENVLVRTMQEEMSTPRSLWLGATDLNSEGEFFWRDGISDQAQFWTGGLGGSAVGYANFSISTGNPSDTGGTEEYVEMRLGLNGEWNDIDNSGDGGGNAYIIEWDASEVLSNFTFSLTDSANGRFAIDQNTGEITVADGSLLDYDNNSSHNVTVEVTDAAGNSYSESIAIAIDNSPEASQTLPTNSYLSEHNTHNPVIHLRLGESSGTTAYDSVGNNDGTYQNGVVLGTAGAVSGDTDTAVTFNNNEYIEVAHSSDLMLDEGTFQLWFKTSDITQDGTLFSKDASGFVSGGHITAEVKTNGEIEVRLQSNDNSYFVRTNNATQPISENTWHHMAFSFGTNGMRLYIDGQLMDTDAYTGGLATSSGGSGNYETLLIGAGNTVSSPGTTNAINSYYEGEIDEFSLLSSQLSDADILSLYNANASTLEATEDTPYVFSTANNNAVSVSDTIAATDTPLQVTLSVNDGVLNLSQTTGITFVEGAQGSGAMVIEGTESALNAAFEGMTFTPFSGFSGSVSLNMQTAIAADLETNFTFDSSTVSGSTINDQAAGVAYNGTLNGNAGIVNDANRGDVLSLDGSDDFIEISGLIGEPENLTLSGWINASSIDSFGASIISMGGSPALYLNNSGFITAYYESGGVNNLLTGDVSLVGTGWRHVAMTVDHATNELSMYVDGVLYSNMTANGPIEYDHNPNTFIGRAGDGLGGFDFDGMIDDARIYSRALSAAEIQALASDQAATVNETVSITVASVNDAPTFSVGDGVVTSFGATAGYYTKDLMVQEDGKYVVVGVSNDGGNNMVSVSRFNEDGTLDTSFGTNGRGTTALGTSDSVNGGAIQADGKILVVGATNVGSPIASAIWRFNADGTLDTSFGSSGSVTMEFSSTSSEYLRDVAVQADGKIVVTGYANSGDEVMTVARLNEDGSLDSSFNSGSLLTLDLGAGDDDVNALAIQDDGKIVLAGSSGSYSSSNFAIVRLNQDGSYDNSFATSGVFTHDVNGEFDGLTGVAIDDQGRIVASGTSRVGAASSESVVLRLDTNGNFDNTFNTTGIHVMSLGFPHESIDDMVLQDDGKILLTGTSYAASGANDVSVVRLNTDGSLDNTFAGDGTIKHAIGTSTDSGDAIAVDRNGNVIVTGRADGTSEGSHLLRFTSDGQLDSFTTFAAGTTTLDNTLSVTEGGSTVLFDSDVKIYDEELSRADDFGGATLTIGRAGGGNLDDRFDATGNLSFDSGTLRLSGSAIGTESWIGGELTLTFASGVTNAQVNEVMQSIGYRFVGKAPPASVDIDWTFSDGNTSSAQGSGGELSETGTITVSITSVNDAPVLNDLSGDLIAVLNDGTEHTLDAAKLSSVVDPDGASDFDGGVLQVTGNSFDGLDNLGLDTSGTVTLSAGLTNSSVVNVSGVAVGTLSGVTNDTLTITLNANATTTEVTTLLQSLTFSSTANNFGDRSVDISFNDGDGVANGGNDSSTISMNINVASSTPGSVTTNEDTTYTFTASDFEFSGIAAANIQSITITALPTSGSLELNNVAITLNQQISKADIDAGLLRYVPAANENGNSAADFSFYVNEGLQAVTLLPGSPSTYTLGGSNLTDLNELIADASNFGVGGTISAKLQVSDESNTVDAAYLNSGDILFDGYVTDSALDAGELAAIDTWVAAGGVLISTNDSSTFDPVATHFGLTIGGTASTTWNIADATHPIMNGVFGSVGSNGDPFTASGTISYFDSASLQVGDVILAVDSVSGEPTMVLREYGDGVILFTSDEGLFRGNTTGGGAVTTPNDILSANVFAWAVSALDNQVVHQMDIDITAVNNDAITDAHYTTWIGDSEFIVNTQTTNNQDDPEIAALVDGGFVVAWESLSQDGDSYGIYFQRYDAAGNAVGSETQVNTTTTDSQQDVEITALNNGGFVVTWESELQDTDGRGVYTRVYDAAGVATTGEIQVNTTTSSNQDNPEVTALTGGGFVIAWESSNQDGSGDGVYFQRFDDTGTPQGVETLANTTTTGNQNFPRITSLNNGGFLVGWNDDSSGNEDAIVQRFDATGNKVGGEITVNTTTSDSQGDVEFVGLSSGGFAVVWESANQDGDGDGVYGRIYDNAGSPTTAEFLINSTTVGEQQDPKIKVLADGGFIVVWESDNQDGDGFGVYGQQFDASGSKVNGEFQLNTTTASNQDNPDVAVLADGRLVGVWESLNQDGSNNAVVGRIFSPSLNENSPVGTVAAVVSQIVDPDSGQSYTYSLVDDAGGAFDIQSDGTIIVLDPSLIDYETATSMNVTVRVTDPVTGFHDEVVSIQIQNLAEAEHTVPGAQNINEDEVLTFSTGNGNAITVTDTLAGTDALMQVTLSANDGLLTLSQTTGLTFVNGANGTSTFTFSGTESDINAALEGLTFTPNANFNGAVTLNITTELAADLEGYYTFEGGNANDQSSGTANNGVFIGDATTITDVDRGEVLNLDGTGDYVEITGTFNQPNTITIGGWVNFTAAGRAEFISLDDRVHIALDDGGNGVKGSVQIGASSWNDLSSGISLSGTGWNHVMYTFDDTNDVHTLYINGEIVATETITDSVYWTGATNTYIGQHPTNSWDLNGMVDDVRIYDRAITADEIQSLASSLTTAVSDSVAITVNSVNDGPVLTTNPGGGTYNENTTPNHIDIGASVSDVDSPNFDGGVLTATLTGNGTANDRLVVIHEGNGVGELEVSGSNLLIDSVVIGSFSGGNGVGDPLVVTFNTQADATDVTKVAQQVGYENVSDDPSGLQRQITLQVTDGDGGTSSAGVRVMNVIPINDEQVLATNTGTTVTQYSSGNVITTAMLHTTDVDNTDSELIYIVDTAPTRGTLYNNGTALGVSDTFTQADIDAGLITYDHNNLFTTADTFDFRVNDGTGSSTSDTFTINVNNVNDATTISLVETSDLDYTENDGAVNITDTLTLFDVDDLNLESAVVQITGNYVNGEDILSFTDQNGISGTWDASTGTLTLTGTASVANYQTAIRSIEYTNNSEDPSNLTRTVSFTVNDGDTNSNTETRDITVTPVNDLPGIDLNGSDGAGVDFATTFIEGAGAVFVIDTDALIGDLDNSSYQNMTINLAGFVDSGTERIWINGNAFDYGTANLLNTTINGTTFDLTFTGTAFTITNQAAGNIPEADLIGLLRSVAYENTSADPTISARTFTFNVTDSDGGTSATPAVSTVSITGINTEPSGTDHTSSTNEDTDYVFTVSDFGFTDTDGHNFTNVIITTAPTNGILYLDSNSDGIVDGGETLSASATVSVSDITSGLLKFKAASNASGIAYDSFTFQVQDDGGTANGGVDTDQTPNTMTLDVIAVNDAAVVNISATPLNFTEQSPVGIDTGLTITDIDDTHLEGATVRFTAGYENGVDSFNWTPHAGISGNWDAATGTLSFTGTATIADYQSLLRTVSFVNNSDNPDTTTRTFEVFVNDGDINSTPVTRDININAVNDNPVLDLDADDSSGGATGNHIATFTEGDSPVAVIDSDVSITDVDNTTMDRVAMIGQFNGSSDIGEEIYAIAGEQFVIGTARTTTVTVGSTTFELDFDGSALDINLDSGSGVIGDFESLLATMTYEHTGDDPTAGIRSFSFLITDADSGNSNTVTSVVNVTAVNDPPVVDLNGSDGTGLNHTDTFTEGDSPINVTDTDATISDPDDVNFNSIGVNLLGATDGTAEEITIGGYTFQYGVAEVVTRTVGGTDFELDFDGSGFTISEASSGVIPQADADALIRSIQYENTSNDPTTGDRTFDISIQDTSGLNSASSFSTITVAAVNDAPVIGMNPVGPAYTEGLGGVFIDTATTVTDADSANFDTGTLTFSFSANGTVNDQLYIQPQGIAPGEVSLSGSDIIIDSVVIGSFTGGGAGADLIITFNANADATSVEAVAQRVAYSNSSEDPSTLTRTVQAVLTDGDGGTSNTGSRNIDVNAVNDEQTLDNNIGDTVSEGSTGNIITNVMLQTGDVDNTPTEIIYTVDTIPVNGILYNNGVALSATDTFTQADINAGRITYNHDGSQTSSDSFDFTVDDGAGTTISDTFNWTVTNVNDATSIFGVEGTNLNYTENDGATAITSTLTLSDVDDTHLESAVVQITSNYVNGEDILTFVDQNGISGVWDAATGTITLTGTATLADYQTALRSITYTNNSDAPDTNARTVSFTVNDGDNDSNTITRDIDITAVNDDPVISFVGGNINYTENDPATVLDGGTTLTDVDLVDFDGGVLSVYFSANGTGSDRLAIQHQGMGAGDVGVTAGPNEVYYGGTLIGNWSGSGAPLSITFNSNADAAAVEAVMQNITYQNLSDDPSTNIRTIEMQLTDGDGGTSNTINKDVIFTAVNDAPGVATNTGTSVAEGSNNNVITTLMLNESDPDDDGSELSYTVTSMTVNGTLYNNGVALNLNDTFTQADIDAGRITYDHNGSETNSDSFDFSLADGGEDSATPITGTFNFTVTPVNDAPIIATNTGITVNEGSNNNIISTAMLNEGDVDDNGAGISYTVTAVTTQGTLYNNGVALNLNDTFTQADIDAGRITYDHNGSENFTDSFGFRLADGGEDSAGTVNGVFNITVTPVNDPPVAVDDSGNVNEGGSVTINLMGNDTDVDNAIDPTSITIVGGPSNGSVIINGDGTVDYIHDGSETIADAFAYTIRDVSGQVSNTATVTLSINPINDAPIATPDNAVVNEGDSVVINLIANDSDAEGPLDPNSIDILITPTNGILINNNDGTVEYFHDGSETTMDSFTYTVRDATGVISNSTTANITINPINDAPNILQNQLRFISGTTTAMDSSAILATDVDTLDTNLMFSATLVNNGQFEEVANPGVAITNFTQQQINDGEIQFVHFGGGAPFYELAVSDGSLTDGPVVVSLTQIIPTGDPDNPILIEIEATPPGFGDGELISVTVEIELDEDERYKLKIIRPNISDTIGSGGGVEQSTVKTAEISSFFNSTDSNNDRDGDTGQSLTARLFTHFSDLRDIAIENLESSGLLHDRNQLSQNFDQALREFRQQMELSEETDNSTVQFVADVGKTLGLSLSVGSLTWLLRIEWLFSVMLSSMPAWRSFDPLPVLAASGTIKRDEENLTEEEYLERIRNEEQDREIEYNASLILDGLQREELERDISRLELEKRNNELTSDHKPAANDE